MSEVERLLAVAERRYAPLRVEIVEIRPGQTPPYPFVVLWTKELVGDHRRIGALAREDAEYVADLINTMADLCQQKSTSAQEGK